jgi:NDP-sugar pyrophosphorylase family protein
MPLPVVVLAGGLATRMLPMTSRMPKVLLPVAGTPFLDLQLSWLRSQSIERVIISTGRLGDMVRFHVRRHGPYGLAVDIIDDGTSLRGTGGAVRSVIDSGLVDDAFFVLNGDSFLSVSFDDVESTFRSTGLPALMTVLRNQGRWDSSNVVFADGRVVLYDKRPDSRVDGMEWIDYGLSAIQAAAISGRVAADAVADLSDVMHDLSVRGQLGGFEVTERFYEIGSPTGLHDLEKHLAHRPRSLSGG